MRAAAVASLFRHSQLGLTDSDMFSQSCSQENANPMRGERRFSNGTRLDCSRDVCND